MWRDGFDLELFTWILNALALAFGAAMGARALIDPRWAQRFVRLKPDEAQPGGFAEFRATYGGVILGLHAVALLITMQWILGGAALLGVYAAGAAAAIAAAWMGSAGGRVLAILLDGVRTRFNTVSAVVEVLVALCIGAPWVVWFFYRPA